jgi:hypothetical protein
LVAKLKRYEPSDAGSNAILAKSRRAKNQTTRKRLAEAVKR